MNRTRSACSVTLLVLCASACTAGEGGNTQRADTVRLADAPGCPDDEAIELFLSDWRAHQPTSAIVAPDASLDAALCAQAKIIDRLQSELGPIVGYKAGLTSASSQERFGAREPVRGVLLEGMLLPDSASIPGDFGARPLFEADLLLVIGDASVNNAASALEILPHLSAVVPFIELPDLAVAEDEPLNATVLTAINVAARLGVVGRPIPVVATPEFFGALADMTVRVSDDQGAELAVASGSAVLGHPLNAVLWLIASGVNFQPGDYVSVGSIGPLLPAESGRTVQARYEGLPGNPTVTVHFR